MTTAYEVAFGPHRPPFRSPITDRAMDAFKHGYHLEWPEPEPCGPPSDPNRSHIYREPRWVPDA